MAANQTLLLSVIKRLDAEKCKPCEIYKIVCDVYEEACFTNGPLFKEG